MTEDLVGFRTLIDRLFAVNITDPNVGVSFSENALGAIGGYAGGHTSWSDFVDRCERLLSEVPPGEETHALAVQSSSCAADETLSRFRAYVTRLFSVNIMEADVSDTFTEDALNTVIEYAGGRVSWPEFVATAEALLENTAEES